MIARTSAPDRTRAGFALLEVMLALAVISVIAVTQVRQKTIEARQIGARVLGNEIFQYNNAVRAHVAHYQTEMTASFTPPELMGTRQGVDWLKSASCGAGLTADKNFAHCDFLSGTGGQPRFGNLTFETYFNTQWNAATQQAEVEALTVLVDSSTAPVSGLLVGGEPSPGLSGLAASVASGVSGLLNQSVALSTNSDAVFCVTTASKPGMCDAAVYPSGDYAEGKIVMRVGNYGGEGANDCSVLHTDGACEMKASIGYDPTLAYDERSLVNVSRLISAPAEGLTIGNLGRYAGGTPGPGLVVVDANMDVWSGLSVNDANLAINNGRLVVSQGALPGSGEVQASAFIDNEDSRFLVDPQSESRLSDVRARRLSNNPDAGPNLNLNADGTLSASGQDVEVTSTGDFTMSSGGATSLNSEGIVLNSGTDRSTIIGDGGRASLSIGAGDSSGDIAASADGTLMLSGAASSGGPARVNLGLDSTGNSRVQLEAEETATTGRLTSGEYIKIKGGAVEGAACEETGLLSTSAAGDIMTCKGGAWSGGSGGGLEHLPLSTGGFYSTTRSLICPAGYKRLNCFFRSRDDKNMDRYIGYLPVDDNGCTFYNSSAGVYKAYGYIDCYRMQ